MCGNSVFGFVPAGESRWEMEREVMWEEQPCNLSFGCES